MQFLTELAVISLVGGVIGILLAWGIATLVGQIAANSGTALTPVVSLNAVLLATLFSAAVGLFFGIHPAQPRRQPAAGGGPAHGVSNGALPP